MEEEASNKSVRIRTKLKFMRSEETDAYISFVSQNPTTGLYYGVRQDSKFPKKICVLDKRLSYSVVPNALYDVTMIPMTFTGTANATGYTLYPSFPISSMPTVPQYPGVLPV